MLKISLLLLIGITIGWIIKSQVTGSSLTVDLNGSNINCPTIPNNPKSDIATSTDEVAPLTVAKQCAIDSTQDKTAKKILDPLIAKLLNSRAILPSELTFLNHWHDQADLDSYIEPHQLSPSEFSRIKAKAEVYFNQKYVVALQDLFAAIHSAKDLKEEDTISAEINALVDYIGENFFKLPPTITEDTFLQAMNLVHEKNPHLLSVILLLSKHHLLMGNFDLVEAYIERIPPTEKNKSVIDLMKMKLDETKSLVDSNYNGIPLQRKNNHFFVNVMVNDAITLNLMIDTGASRTVVSHKVMSAMQRMSNGFEDLEMMHRVYTASGRALVNLYRAESISIKGFSLTNPLIMTSTIETDDNMHGLLGMDFLGEYQFRIDHKKNILYLSE